MFLDCSFFITLRFPLMFSYMFTLKSFLVDILLHKMSTEWALHWSSLLGAFKFFAFLSWKNMQWCVLCIEKYLVDYFTFNCSNGVVFYSNCKMLWNCSSWHWYLYTWYISFHWQVSDVYGFICILKYIWWIHSHIEWYFVCVCMIFQMDGVIKLFNFYTEIF